MRKKNLKSAVCSQSQPCTFLTEPLLWHKQPCSPPACDTGMQKVNPGRESASSQRGDGRRAEKSGVSENHRILGYSPNRCSRLVADQVRAVKAPLLDVQIPL